MRLGLVWAATGVLLVSMAGCGRKPPLQWTTNADKTITITGFTAGSEVVIPERITGLPVTSIGGLAFDLCPRLTNVTISANVTNIGFLAFAHCTNLTAIVVDARNPVFGSEDGMLFDKSHTTLLQCPEGKTGSCSIPAGVANIGKAAFFECTGLTNVTIPASVTNIGDVAFHHCIGLTTVTIGSNVTSIGNGAFRACSSLNNITIPCGVISIGHSAFNWCTSLTNVTIPANVAHKEDWPSFVGCSRLTAVTVDAMNPIYSGVDGVLFDKRQTTLIQYPGGKTSNCTIPSGVTSIGNGAFSSCTNLTSVTIPNSVTSIGERVFAYCKNLTGVYFKGNAPTLGKEAFDGTTNATIYYLEGTKGWGPTFGGRPTAVWKPEGGAATNGVPVAGAQR